MVSLCVHCRWVREVVSGSGSKFLLCRLAAEDKTYAKYPAQPVVRCEGFETHVAADSEDAMD